MFNKIAKAMVEGKLLKATIKKIFSFPSWLRKKLDKVISIVAIFILSRSTKVEENKIIFLTFRGEYDCNAKWITEELLKRKVPYQLVWTIRKSTDRDLLPEEVILTYRGSYDFFKHLSSAKIIVDNGISTAYLGYKKKKKQVLVETWHGSLGIKKFSKDAVKDKVWVAAAFAEGAMTDYIISNSSFEDEIYREDYWKKTRILQLGHARNDILCEGDSERVQSIRKKIFDMYQLPEGTKICLYAPTFRDDGDMRPYKLDYAGVLDALQTRFGGEWVIMTRFHFRMLKKIGKYKYPENVINASTYPDIQELAACTDVGITDYSSWICEYLLTNRPGFMFATDIKEYQKKDRNFYFPLTDLPYPVANRNDRLIQNILNFDNEKFLADCEAFLKEKGCIDDGHASERIADAIGQIMEGAKL